MKYIFIRLLATNILQNDFKYRSGKDTLREIIFKYKGLTTINEVHKYNHAQINYLLNDNFVDINFRLTDTVRISNSFDRKDPICKKSMYSIYGIKVTDSEYDKVKSMIKEYLDNPNLVRYSIKDLLTMSKSIATGNYLNKLLFSEGINLATQESLVCSSFIMHILTKCVSKINDWVLNNNINIHYISPSDLVKIPGMIPFIVWRNCATGQSDISKLARKLAVDY